MVCDRTQQVSAPEEAQLAAAFRDLADRLSGLADEIDAAAATD